MSCSFQQITPKPTSTSYFPLRTSRIKFHTSHLILHTSPVSTKVSYFALRGDYRNALADILQRAQQPPSGDPIPQPDWRRLSRALDKALGTNPQAKAMFRSEGWTVVLDPEGTLWRQQQWLLGLSLDFRTRVVGVMVDEARNKVGFGMYEGRISRFFAAEGGGIVEEVGTLLPEEARLDKDGFFDTDYVLNLSRGIGLNFEKFDEGIDFHLQPAGRGAAAAAQAARATKPWWKFW